MKRALMTLGTFALLTCTSALFAQDAEPATDDRAAVFQAVQGPTHEQVPGGTLLLLAYGIVWLLLLGFVAHIGRLQQTARRRIDRLEQALQAEDAGPPFEG